jgi:hypothetical protein
MLKALVLCDSGERKHLTAAAHHRLRSTLPIPGMEAKDLRAAQSDAPQLQQVFATTAHRHIARLVGCELAEALKEWPPR